MDFVDLVKLVVAGEQREKSQYLKVDTAHAPVVHLVIIVAVGEETLGGSVPASRNVLSEGWLRVDPSTGAKISQLHLVLFEENILTVTASRKC